VDAAVVEGDFARLYAALAKPLERIVRLDVHAPDQVIEEACQFAWAKLVHHRSRVRRDAAQAWLVKTAVHEALKLLGRCRRELSLEAEMEPDREGSLSRAGWEAPDRQPGPPEVCEQRDRLSRLSVLSRRQQRLLWLYGLGLSYDEIAAQSGCTRRTVERQLQRARAALRAVDPG
jgi:RNA polymerase sigma factor (sigma-70 family)